jgi:uncharacterized membrane protein YqaE (UPF0057 family)
MNVSIFHFASGLLFIHSTAPLINNHSHTQAHNQVNQIANQAQTQAIQDNQSMDKIWNDIINAYIAADSTNATHRIETVNKKLIIFGFLHITSNAHSERYHLPIPTHNQANQIDNQAHKYIIESTSNKEDILNAIIKPYIAVTSTNATNKTINVSILLFILGFLSIAEIAQATSTHSQTHAHNQANQIANQDHIEA